MDNDAPSHADTTVGNAASRKETAGCYTEVLHNNAARSSNTHTTNNHKHFSVLSRTAELAAVSFYAAPSGSQEITMHWKKTFFYTFLWIFDASCDVDLLYVSGSLRQQVKGRGKTTCGRVMMPHWDEIKQFFVAAALFGELPFINWCWILLSPPLSLKQWNNKTFSSRGGRRGRISY